MNRFGNLIGGDSPQVEDNDEPMDLGGIRTSENHHTDSTALVKSELDAAFDEDVEILVETKDQQSLETPLVEPEADMKSEFALYTTINKKIPQTTFDREYMLELLKIPERIINVAVIGPLHSGKTSLLDLIALESHKDLPYVSRNIKQGWRPLRYMDNTKLEIDRGISCKLNGLTTLGTNLNNKSTAFTFLDSPGHFAFADETAVALAAADCCLIVIDAVEGITSIVQHLIKQAEKNKLPMIFMLNKIDRLILELKLPPKDAFLKLSFIIDQINTFAKNVYSPELGNVIFGSTKLGFTFTIKEFVIQNYGNHLDARGVELFTERLWGDVYSHGGSFSTNPNAHSTTTFVEFILLPIYKVFTNSLTNEPQNLSSILKKEFKIGLAPDKFHLDPLPLLRHVLKLIFGTQKGLIHSINSSCLPSSEMSLPKQHEFGLASNEDPTVAHVLKHVDYCGQFWSLVRVYKGTLTTSSNIRLVEAGNLGDDTVKDVKIERIALLGGRYTLPVDCASEGQIVLLKGLGEFYTKSGTISSSGSVCFRPLDYINGSVFKIVIQPYHPRELPQMLDGLNKINMLYPGVVINVEETGENVILGSGELYLDCLMYELRTNYAGIEIRTSNPLTKFSESCSNESFAAIPVKTSSGQVTLCIGAQRMDRKLVQDLEKGVIKDSDLRDRRTLSKALRQQYGWDSLEARNVWSFHNGNVLVNDTIPDEVDRDVLANVKDAIIQGFQWSTKEGPLAEEPIYGVHFRLLNVDVVGDVYAGQLIPLARKACYVALLTAQPVLLEPIYEVDIVAHEILSEILEELFQKRRGGRIYQRVRIPATSLVEIKAQLPVIESAGFETDLRLATNGGGMCQLHFCNKIWRKVPGDVMNEDAFIPKLKPAPIESLSRDFVMKTRRRKGLSSEGYNSKDGPSLSKYIEAELYEKLKENELV